jgi:hypothetical protein
MLKSCNITAFHVVCRRRGPPSLFKLYSKKSICNYNFFLKKGPAGEPVRPWAASPAVQKAKKLLEREEELIQNKTDNNQIVII